MEDRVPASVVQPIARRDFLNGAALAIGGAAWPPARGDTAAAAPAADPALRTGLQGQTDAVNAAAHRWRDDPTALRNATAERDAEVEDLVVVGAGISGLAGARLYQQHAGRPVRILLLDALDDIGGHARRNEFVSRSGARLIGYGGSQSLDSPGLFSPAALSLLAGLGIELERFKAEYFDAGWAERQELRNTALYFDGDRWDRSAMVIRELDEPVERWAARAPLSPRAQADLQRLLSEASPGDPLPALRTRAARRAALAGMTYRDFLRRHWRVDPQVARLFAHDTQGYFGVGIDATSALDAWANGLPGFNGLDLGDAVDPRMSPSGRQLKASEDEYIYHFPDGNAGVARALVRALIPQALPGAADIEAMVGARLDTARLDEPESPVRLRLQATAIGLRHLGPVADAELVELRYVDGQGRVRVVRARQVLLACWHRVIARLTDELPAAQVAALNDQIKVPLIYGTVLLSNWQAWQRAGIASFNPVDGFWGEVALDFPVSMGAARFPQSADQPILLHVAKVVVPGDGTPARQQAAKGRAQMAGWSFDFLERQLRRTLQGALGAHGFDAARDIEAITMNRWAHGYAYEYMRPWDTYWPRGPLPCLTARRGWGRVAIANADAGAYAYAHGAIDQATRAVQALLPQAKLPEWNTVPGPNLKQIGLA